MQYGMISVVAATAGLVHTVKQCCIASVQALHGCRVADIVGMHAGIDFLMVPPASSPEALFSRLVDLDKHTPTNSQTLCGCMQGLIS